jgi:Arc/MetJ-type ribon-helix-helix transcriptional regulator
MGGAWADQVTIPMRYGHGMSVQFTIRVPDELADFVDQSVRDGRATSRADAIAQALSREHRRRVAERDLELLIAYRAAHADDSDDLGALAEMAADTTLDID